MHRHHARRLPHEALLVGRGQWERVGQVVGGPESGDMQVGTSSVNGQQYDHVISVEVDDRGQPLRLGVNRGDNPYTVADRSVSVPVLVDWHCAYDCHWPELLAAALLGACRQGLRCQHVWLLRQSFRLEQASPRSWKRNLLQEYI